MHTKVANIIVAICIEINLRIWFESNVSVLSLYLSDKTHWKHEIGMPKLINQIII